MKIAQIAKKHPTPAEPYSEAEPDGNVGAEQTAAPILPTPGANGPEPSKVGTIQPGATPASAAPDISGSTAPKQGETVTKKGGFLMRGSSAHTAVHTEQAKADLAMSQAGFRFWVPVGGEARVTFIDGNLDVDGALDIPYWYEHRLMLGGRIQPITCYETVSDMGPCPICTAGHKTQLVAGMSVINHTPYVVQKGQNAGKTLTNRRQMLVAPRTAIETFQKLAGKRGGLSTHCFDAYRKEKKDPRVGSVWDYVGQLTPEQIAGFGEEWKPFDWDEAITLIDANDMANFGQTAVPYGGGPQGGGGGTAADLNEIEV